VRLIAATNKDLDRAVEEGTFREDLYYRLKVISLALPPLRDKKEDIPALVNHFISKFNEKNNKSVKGIDRASLNLLQNYPWPGNVRQLENCIETAVVMAEQPFITTELLPLEVRAKGVKGGTVSLSLGTSLKEVEREMIIQTLSHVKGNKTKAAQILGIGIRTLYRKLEEYGWKDGPEN
jgi:DNA-binding NtrC family response regulator